jgi:predicted enzyme related to lactoylglutathione lyase
MIQALHRLRLISSDIKISKLFFENLFDVKPIEELTTFIAFKLADAYLEIILEDTKNTASTCGSIGYWIVDDLDSYIKKSNELGGKIYRGPLEIAETKSRIVQIQDPTGCIIGL